MLSGFMIYKLLNYFLPTFFPYKPVYFLVIAVFSILPDFDVLWSKTVNAHHSTWFHTPIFWIFVCALLSIPMYFFGALNIIFLAGIQVLSHLFFDLLTSRAYGIRVFYPFSEKFYSVFKPTWPVENFTLKDMIVGFIPFMKQYSKTRGRLFIEIIVALVGMMALLQWITVFF
jgi:hypothetical protein